MLKTLFDRVVAFIALVLLSIPLILVSLVIKMLMPGPIFFIQQRIGQHGRPFRLIKFRTMKLAPDKSTESFDAGDNSRITPLGRFLRKTKLDELPQLINVLKGEMSFVGPRPEVKQWTEVYPEKWAIVHSVRPGITDYASMYFRNEEEMLATSQNPRETYKNEILPKKLDLNIEYIKNRSFIEDLKIIFKTLFVVAFK